MTTPYYQQRNQEATVWVGNLEPQVNEELLFELFIQAAPVTNVNMPKDKVTAQHQGYAFIELETPEDADYAIKVMNLVKMFGKPMRVNMAAKDKKQEEFFANLFIGNLDPEVDEKMLHDTFSRFGAVISCKVMTEPDSTVSKGFGFITFDSFESADLAIEMMSGQYLSNRQIHCSYAFKKDGTKGERHGSEEERRLATQSGARNLRPKVDMSFGAMPARPAAAPTAAFTPQHMMPMNGGMQMPGMQMNYGGMQMNMAMMQQPNIQMQQMQMAQMAMQQQQQQAAGYPRPPPPPQHLVAAGRGLPPPPPAAFGGPAIHPDRVAMQQQQAFGAPAFPGAGRGMPAPPQFGSFPTPPPPPPQFGMGRGAPGAPPGLAAPQ